MNYPINIGDNMKLLLPSLLAVFFFVGCSTTSTNTTIARKIPLTKFFKNPKVAQFQISPDGRYYSYLKPYKKRMNVYVQEIGKGGKAKRVTSLTDRSVSYYFWKENDTLLYSRDFGGDENYHWFSVKADGTGERDLTPFKNIQARLIDDLEGVSKTDVIVGINKRDSKVHDAYRLNVATGEIKMIAKNPGYYTGWLTDHDGKLRVAVSSDGVNSAIYYRKTEKGKFRKILSTNFRTTVYPMFFTFDNKKLYVVSNKSRNHLVAAIFNPRTRREEKIIFSHPEVDVDSLYYSRKRKKLISASYTTWKNQKKFFDPIFEAIFKDMRAKLPEKQLSVTGMTEDESKMIVRAHNDRTRGAYYLYDTNNKKLTHLSDLSPWLPESQLAEMKPIQYKSRDGLTIHGYLTLPKGADAKDLPLVVNPHGGPWARDKWGFNPEVQFLANRGYAVLQMNFRGSTGYGKRFWIAGFKEWGKKMQNDVTDGVKHLVSKGVVNKDKVCIYGASYGGYATLAGLTFTPDVYACGVDYVGISNLFTFMETIPPYWEPYRKMMYEMVGHPKKDKKLLTATSPAFHVNNIKVPLFIAQGAKDPRVKKAESDQMVEALRKNGVEVPYMVKENEGHGFHNEENRIEFYSNMEKFLKENIL